MDCVWVVEEGEYSDYHIEAIFSTKEQAEEFVAHSSECRVVEWKLDRWTPDKAQFRIKFDLQGNITSINETAYIEPIGAVDAVHTHRSFEEPNTIVVVVGRGPRELAIKIASERYARLRAVLDEADERVNRSGLYKRRNDAGCYRSLTMHVAHILAGLCPPPEGKRLNDMEQSVLKVLGAEAK